MSAPSSSYCTQKSYLEQQASIPLYDGAPMSRLFTILLFPYMQVIHKMTNVCLDDLLKITADSIIPRNLNLTMPNARQEARKVLSKVGLEYIIIHCCPCDEFLYYGLGKDILLHCPHCSLYQCRTDTQAKNILREKMYYFPLIPCLLAQY